MAKYRIYESTTKYGCVTRARYNTGIDEVNHTIEQHMEKSWYKHYVEILKKIGNRWFKIITIHDGVLTKTKNYPNETK